MFIGSVWLVSDWAVGLGIYREKISPWRSDYQWNNSFTATWKLSSFNFFFHGEILIFKISFIFSWLRKQRILCKEVWKSKMKTSQTYQSGIEIWIKDQKTVLQIPKATLKAYFMNIFMAIILLPWITGSVNWN